jgi:hypothetical protein
MRRVLISSLIAVAVGCARHAQVGRGDSAVQVSSREQGVWEWSTDNGDKPGVGLRLMIDTAGMTGVFFLMDPDHPHDFSAAGQAVPLSDLRRSGNELTFTVRLMSGDGYLVEHNLLRLNNELVGQVGDQVHGTLKSTDNPASVDEEVVLVRRK